MTARDGKWSATRPPIRNVLRHMFVRYDDDDDGGGGGGGEDTMRLCCVTCNRVISAPGPDPQSAAEAHFDACVRGPSAPAETVAFRCGPCNLSTKNFNHWKYFHVATRGHGARCDAVRGCSGAALYTKTCWSCETVLYDTEMAIGSHALECSSKFNQHHGQQQQQQHHNHHRGHGSLDVPALSLFMAHVYRLARSAGGADGDAQETAAGGGGGGGPDGQAQRWRRQRRRRLAYYCAGCHEWADGRPVHPWPGVDRADRAHAAAETFHCATCRATFACDETAYRWHLTSVEHVALEREACGDGSCGHVEGVPRIVWRRFDRPEGGADASVVCRACRLLVAEDASAVLRHAESCAGLRPIGGGDGDGDGDSCYRTFWCAVCSARADDAAAWARHVTSAAHLTLCREMRYFAHYECASADCRALYYGTFARVERCHATDWRHRLRPVPVADLMRRVYDDRLRQDDGPGATAAAFFYRQDTGAFGRCDPSAGPVPRYCAACRVEFYGDATAYRQHAATVEHLLLRRFAADPPRPRATPAAVAPGRDPGPEFQQPQTLRRRAEDEDEDAVDEAYGRYVIARLKAIRDRELKSNVKLAIDALFDLNAR